MAEGKAALTELAAFASRATREPVPISELVVGMKCGGSDGLSGVTANPLCGLVCDALTDAGATVALSEVPEMFGAEQLLMNRCRDEATFEKTVRLIEDFKQYFTSHGQVVYENPSPGNKAGGITTLEDKSCGCVQKGGRATIQDVYRYGERFNSPPLRGGAWGGAGGLVLLEAPGSDMVSSTALAAAGCQLMLFTTGRGTPFGAPIPTIKISTNAALAAKKPRWIDFDASPILREDSSKIRDALLRLVFDVANGKTRTKAEHNGCREMDIWKNGVTV
jgi:altronate hydrolase